MNFIDIILNHAQLSHFIKILKVGVEFIHAERERERERDRERERQRDRDRERQRETDRH
jgi:hypothetical protein